MSQEVERGDGPLYPPLARKYHDAGSEEAIREFWRTDGTFARSLRRHPIDVALGGPLFADGAGANDVIARLPLADGYTASFLNFDVESQKVTVSRLQVAGTEQVTVPALADWLRKRRGIQRT